MTCSVCKGETFTEWGQANGYAILQCSVCGLGVTTPFPDLTAQASVNEDTYSLDERISIYMSRKGYFEKRYRAQLRDIGKFCRTGKLLDIGCNIGMFLDCARSDGFEVAGVELNRSCAEYARSTYGLDVRATYLEQAGFDADSFDVVTMFDVLEHVTDMERILAEVRRILKPGGLLVVQSPNLASVMAETARSGWSWLTPPDHLYHFTPGSLSRLLTCSGYVVTLLKTWEPADAFCVDVMQALLGSSFPARVVRKLLRITGIAELLVSTMQHIWWRRQKGALVEAYAIKPTETAVTP